ncbi:hypothetical protein AB0M43_14355 [Longispora sp. NPDC051575]|uniref:hypothetical protein n=1 Tax=Longispora sp. NPDC051575 TaxID=3154943 RepID=UPI0034454973
MALYLFFLFKNSMLAPASFLAYGLGVVIESWVTNFATAQPPPTPASRSAAANPMAHQSAYQPAAAVRERDAGGALSMNISIVVLMVMADSFFLTTWLTMTDEDSGFAALIKIVASLLCLALAFLGPIAIGVFSYIALDERFSARLAPNSQYAEGAGCLAGVSAAALTVVCYGHFLLAALLYSAFGATNS